MTKDSINSIQELLKAQKYDLAEEQLEQYLQFEPGDWDAKILLGTCYMFQGNMKKAKSLYVLIQRHLKSEKSVQSSLVKQYLKISAILLGSATLIAGGFGAYHCYKNLLAVLSMSLVKYGGAEYYQYNHSPILPDKHRYSSINNENNSADTKKVKNQ